MGRKGDDTLDGACSAVDILAIGDGWAAMPYRRRTSQIQRQFLREEEAAFIREKQAAIPGYGGTYHRVRTLIEKRDKPAGESAMKRHLCKTVRLTILWLVCAACQSATITPIFSPSPPASMTPPATMTQPGEQPAGLPGPLTPTPLLSGLGQPALIEQAMADLATRLDVPVAQIEVIEVLQDEFPLANLGCPQSLKKEDPTIPALVTALVIRLRALDADYEYHAHGRRVVFCGAG